MLPEFQEEDIDNLPIMKATCIKFLFMFRNQTPEEHTVNFVQLLNNFLKSFSKVTQSYAAATIEKMLVKKSKQTGQPIMTVQTVDQ